MCLPAATQVDRSNSVQFAELVKFLRKRVNAPASPETRTVVKRRWKSAARTALKAAKEVAAADELAASDRAEAVSAAAEASPAGRASGGSRFAKAVEAGVNEAASAATPSSKLSEQERTPPKHVWEKLSEGEMQAALREKLPPSWEAVPTADGRVYYWNSLSDETTWMLPRA